MVYVLIVGSYLLEQIKDHQNIIKGQVSIMVDKEKQRLIEQVKKQQKVLDRAREIKKPES